MEVCGALLVPRRHASPLLEPVDEPLDAIALAVRGAVERTMTSVVRALVRPPGYHRTDAAARELPPHHGVAIALVADEALGPHVDLRREAASRAPDRLGSRRAMGTRGVLVRPDDGAVSTQLTTLWADLAGAGARSSTSRATGAGRSRRSA
jgi:hypothetical protein